MTLIKPKPQGSIIVVEDDELTRAGLTEALTEAGFNVIQAVDADDARMLLEHGATGIHALITDNRMPGSMDGVRLARHAHENWPWIHLVLAAYLVEAEAVLPRGCRYFQKPYRVAHLVEHLRALGRCAARLVDIHAACPASPRKLGPSDVIRPLGRLWPRNRVPS